MFQKGSTDWSVQTLYNKVKKGQVTFDNAVQRGEVWKNDNKRKSLLIHSLIEDYFVPPLYAKKERNIYDMLDGKQRSSTIFDFLNNKFELSDETPVVQLDSGDTYKVGGKHFNDLPEEIQDRIRDFSLIVYFVENASQDEIREAFFRLNNGKAMTNKERTRIKQDNLQLIQDAAQHEILKIALTPDVLERGYTDEDFVLKTWSTLNNASPSFEGKDILLLRETPVITTEHIREINDYYTRLLNVYRYIQTTGRGSKKVCRRMLLGIHFIALTLMARRSIADSISIESFSKWIKIFFSGKEGISINDSYNEASRAEKNKTENILIRHKILYRHYEDTLINKVRIGIADNGIANNERTKTTVKGGLQNVRTSL